MPRKLKLNGTARWIFIVIAIITLIINTGGIVWNAVTLHYGVKENTAVLQNDITHLTADVSDIKMDIKAINTYLLERTGQ